MIQQTASSQLAILVEGSLSVASYGLSARPRVTTPGVSTCFSKVSLTKIPTTRLG